jgi:hypothetical protein
MFLHEPYGRSYYNAHTSRLERTSASQMSPPVVSALQFHEAR